MSEAGQSGLIEVEMRTEEDRDGGRVNGVIEPLGGAAAGGTGQREIGFAAGVRDEVGNGATEGQVQVADVLGPGCGVVAPGVEEEVDGGQQSGEHLGANLGIDELECQVFARSDQDQAGVPTLLDTLEAALAEGHAGPDEGAAPLVEDAGAQYRAGFDVRNADPLHRLLLLHRSSAEEERADRGRGMAGDHIRVTVRGTPDLVAVA
ncbi:MAG: hypothetical protein V3V06_06650 [Dehalococcoidia bacterium]